MDFKEFAMGLLILGGNSASQHLEDETLDFVFRLVLRTVNIIWTILFKLNNSLYIIITQQTIIITHHKWQYIINFRLHDENNDGDIAKEEAEKVIYDMIYCNIMSDEYTIPNIRNLYTRNLVTVGDSNDPREDLSRVL